MAGWVVTQLPRVISGYITILTRCQVGLRQSSRTAAVILKAGVAMHCGDSAGGIVDIDLDRLPGHLSSVADEESEVKITAASLH